MDYVRPVVNVALATSLLLDLDAGEAEAIALAVESKADWLLIDERLAGEWRALRAEVRRHPRLALKAKHDGHLVAIKAVLDDLRSRAGFHVSEELYKTVLQNAGEPS